MTVKCPSCDQTCKSGVGVAIHWSKSHEGKPPDELDTSRSEEFREKMSEVMQQKWEDDYDKQCELIRNGLDDFWSDDENRRQRRRRQSEVMETNWEDDDFVEAQREAILDLNQRPRVREVIETENIVRNGWEEEIDLLLYESSVDYDYEPTTYELEDRFYTPDFETENTVIEVKGRPGDGEREQQFLEQSKKLYIVIGSKHPCDVHIPWSERESLLEYIQ